jgi:hypothetical protein
MNKIEACEIIQKFELQYKALEWFLESGFCDRDTVQDFMSDVVIEYINIRNAYPRLTSDYFEQIIKKSASDTAISKAEQK